jgi:glutamine synthetase
MANEIQQFFRERGISEVEAIIPDMAGIARGKIMPAEKFAEDAGMRLPESIFLQTVTGDYPPDTTEAMSPAEIDIVLRADPKTVRVVPWAAEPTAQVAAGDRPRARVLFDRAEYRCRLSAQAARRAFRSRRTGTAVL